MMRNLLIVLQAKDMASGVIGGVGGKLGGLGKMAAFGLGGLAVGAAGAGAAILKFAKDAAPLEGVQKAFTGIAESTGKSMHEMLGELKKGSLGMITNRDLMMKYNEAAQLVGTQFANELPNAFQYLTKVSAATGQDMGFMMDSLVKGVGRLSPMILDNLGIQVNLSMATEKASEMFEKQADSLSKAELQQGMMAVAMEKLAENTAAMPDIAENASTKFAQMGTKMSDLKDTIGLALIPIVLKVMDAFTGLADNAIPLIKEAFDKVLMPLFKKITPVIEALGKAFRTTIGIIVGLFKNLMHAFTEGEDMHPSEYIPGFFELPEGVQGVLETVQGFLYDLLEMVRNVVDTIGPVISNLSDFFGGLIEKISFGWGIGDFFRTFEDGSSVLSGFFEILGLGEGPARAIADIFNLYVQHFLSLIDVGQTVMGIFFGIAQNLLHLFTAGEGMHPSEFIPGFFELPESVQEIVSTITAVLQDLVWWLMENIPKAVATASAFWTNTLYPAILKVIGYIQQVVIPAFLAIVNWMVQKIPVAIQTVSDFWTNTLQPALERVGNFITNTVIPIIRDIADWIGSKLPQSTEEAVGSATGFMDTISTVFGTILTVITGVLNEVVPFIAEMMGKVVTWVQDNWPLIQEAVSDTMGTIQTIIETVLGAIKKFWIDHGEKIMDFIGNLWSLIKFIISNALDLILGVIRSVLMIISGDWEGAWENIKEVVKTIWRKIMNWLLNTAGPWIVRQLGKVAEIVLQAGTEIMEALWEGMKKKWEEIKKWFTDKLEWLWGQLPGSEPKDKSSPLVGLSKAGEAIMDNILEGLKKGMAKVKGEFSKFLYELRGLADLAGVFSSFAAGAAGLYTTMLQKATDKQLKDLDVRASRAEARFKWLSKMWETKEYAEGWDALRVHEEIRRVSFERFAIDKQRESALNRQKIAMEEIAQLEEQQMRLSYLQQQLGLLDTIQQYGLDAQEILGGMQLGLGGSLTDMISSMSVVTEKIIIELDRKLSTLPGLGLGSLEAAPRWIPEEFWEFAQPREVTVYGGITIENVENLQDLIDALEMP